ncbi:MAG: hypothetical protein V4673_14035 [Pseudomonadota bacterium]
MFRLGLLATLSALILTGCVSTYAYRDDQGGDYYYSEPSVQYHDVYGAPYSSIGYGYPGGWYGSFGYGFGYGHTPYSRFGFPYRYDNYRYGFPYSYYPYPHRRPHHPRPPHVTPPGTPPPGTQIGDRDRDGGPWRHLDRRRRPVDAIPMPGSPPVRVVRDDRPQRRIMVTQPGLSGSGGDRQPGAVPQMRRAPVSMPEPGAQSRPRMESPRPRMESPRPSPPERRIEPRERESRRDTTP